MSSDRQFERSREQLVWVSAGLDKQKRREVGGRGESYVLAGGKRKLKAAVRYVTEALKAQQNTT